MSATSQDIPDIVELLKVATAQITEEYMQLPVAGQSGVPYPYRERVYCYELYHQLRCLLPARSDYVLSGEVSKRTHPVLTTRDLGNVVPDLLIHKPGTMEHNLLAIEVKHVKASKLGMKKDLETLTALRRRGDYRRVLYLIFGDLGDRGARLERLKTNARCIANEEGRDKVDLDLIELLWHRRPQEQAVRQTW